VFDFVVFESRRILDSVLYLFHYPPLIPKCSPAEGDVFKEWDFVKKESFMSAFVATVNV
jgi:hypothetical protein